MVEGLKQDILDLIENDSDFRNKIRKKVEEDKDREKEEKESIDRRQFLKKAGAGVAGIGAAAMMPSATGFTVTSNQPFSVNNRSGANLQVGEKGNLDLNGNNILNGNRAEVKAIDAGKLNNKVVVKHDWSAEKVNSETENYSHLKFKGGGDYEFNKPILLRSGMLIEGPGPVVWEEGESAPSNKGIIKKKHDGNVFEVADESSGGVQGLTVRDITLHGNKESTSGGYCIEMGRDNSEKESQFVQRFRVENVSMLEAPEGGIYSDRSFNGVVRDCMFRRFGRPDGSNNADSFLLVDEGGSVPSHWLFENNDFRGGDASSVTGRDHIRVENCQGFNCINNDINHANNNLVWIQHTNGGIFHGNRGEPANDTKNGFVFGSNKEDKDGNDMGSRVIRYSIIGNHSEASGRQPSGIGMDFRKISKSVIKANHISGYPTEISTNPSDSDGYVANCEFGANDPQLGGSGWNQEPGASGEQITTNNLIQLADGDIKINDGDDSTRLRAFSGGLTSLLHSDGTVVAQTRNNGALRAKQGELQLGDSGALIKVNDGGQVEVRDASGNTTTIT